MFSTEWLVDSHDNVTLEAPFNVYFSLFQHKSVCSFPSECFYDTKLVPHVSARERKLETLNSFWPNGICLHARMYCITLCVEWCM